MRSRSRQQRGFSLIEILIAVAILLAVTAIVFSHITVFQNRSRVEQGAVENFQDSRASLDLINRDLHSAGFPNQHQYNSSPSPVLSLNGTISTDPRAANGVYSLTATRLVMEGDVNSDGVVEQVIYQLIPDPAGNGNSCPCVLQRAQVSKVLGSMPDTYGNAASNFTTVAGGIINSGGTYTIAGTTTAANGTVFTLDTQYASYKAAPVFTALYSDGTTGTTYTYGTNTQILRSVKVNLNIMGTLADPQSGLMPVASLVSSNRVYQPQ